jgi:hypothetical protein
MTNANTPGSSNSSEGLLTPDAGPDTSRATYSDEQADLNDSSHDLDNTDEIIPSPSGEDSKGHVVDRQLSDISHLPG